MLSVTDKIVNTIDTEMCNRPRLVIDLVIDHLIFQSNRNRSFLQNNNRNPVKNICV